MTVVEQVQDYRFTGVDLPIATVRRRLAEITKRFNLKVERWEEDGLGPAQGVLIRLPSGKVMLLRELEHAIERLGAKGPSIHVEASDLAEVGVDPLIAEVLDALDLPRDDLDWIASEESRATAIDMVRWLRNREVAGSAKSRDM